MPMPSEILADVFGYAAFRGRQQEVVEAVVRGDDVLAIMPTGAGKSICYQVPAIVRAGTGLVVSPLIALMHDQVRALTANGVAAAALTSADDEAAQRTTLARLHAGDLALLYVSPERAATGNFQAMLARVPLSLIAIDEAHCVSQWGHDFRPEYRQLRALCDRFPGVPRVALTATADLETRADILAELGIAPDRLVVAGFDRPNICYEVVPRRAGSDQLGAFVRRHVGQSGIIYAPSRAKTEATAEALVKQGVKARAYHAGMTPAVRAEAQAAFTHADDLVMVATIAFGMGIDKPDVRFVAHLGMPGSIEAYYQETGRAGRDGGPAVAHLIYGAADIALARRRIDEKDVPEPRRQAEHARLAALVSYCETVGCRRAPLLTYFDEPAPPPCGNCDNCLSPPPVRDATDAARKLLSAVYRTGQRFGIAHLARVLRGEPDARVRALGHDALSVHGIGRDTDAGTWSALARHLVATDALGVDSAHRGLALGPAARAILKGEVAVSLRVDPARRGAARGSAAPPPGDAAEEARFDRLRAARRELATKGSVPAYIIFHDATLRAIAAAAPATIDALGRVPGVGRAKLAAYGAAMLAAIAG